METSKVNQCKSILECTGYMAKLKSEPHCYLVSHRCHNLHSDLLSFIGIVHKNLIPRGQKVSQERTESRYWLNIFQLVREHDPINHFSISISWKDTSVRVETNLFIHTLRTSLKNSNLFFLSLLFFSFLTRLGKTITAIMQITSVGRNTELIIPQYFASETWIREGCKKVWCYHYYGHYFALIISNHGHDNDNDSNCCKCNGNETNLNQNSISTNTNNPMVLSNIQRTSNFLCMELMLGLWGKSYQTNIKLQMKGQ